MLSDFFFNNIDSKFDVLLETFTGWWFKHVINGWFCEGNVVRHFVYLLCLVLVPFWRFVYISDFRTRRRFRKSLNIPIFDCLFDKFGKFLKTFFLNVFLQHFYYYLSSCGFCRSPCNDNTTVIDQILQVWCKESLLFESRPKRFGKTIFGQGIVSYNKYNLERFGVFDDFLFDNVSWNKSAKILTMVFWIKLNKVPDFVGLYKMSTVGNAIMRLLSNIKPAGLNF